MMYPFMTLNDNTEITFSSPLPTQSGERVKVYIETPIPDGFKNATCYLPQYEWHNNGYSEMEMDRLNDLVKSVAHILLRLSKEGGIESA